MPENDFDLPAERRVWTSTHVTTALMLPNNLFHHKFSLHSIVLSHIYTRILGAVITPAPLTPGNSSHSLSLTLRRTHILLLPRQTIFELRRRPNKAKLLPTLLSTVSSAETERNTSYKATYLPKWEFLLLSGYTNTGTYSFFDTRLPRFLNHGLWTAGGRTQAPSSGTLRNPGNILWKWNNIRKLKY